MHKCAVFLGLSSFHRSHPLAATHTATIYCNNTLQQRTATPQQRTATTHCWARFLWSLEFRPLAATHCTTTLQQHTVTTHYNNWLQWRTATRQTHWNNTLRQHTVETSSFCYKTLQHCTAIIHCNNTLQQCTATTHRNNATTPCSNTRSRPLRLIAPVSPSRCNTALQHHTATRHRNKALQQCTATPQQHTATTHGRDLFLRSSLNSLQHTATPYYNSTSQNYTIWKQTSRFENKNHILILFLQSGFSIFFHKENPLSTLCCFDVFWLSNCRMKRGGSL